jgi:putative ABC transport system ATP-binding protein
VNDTATTNAAHETGPLIAVADVHKGYDHDRISALRGVTFTVQPGEIVALMGPSGSGKTTLLNLLAGLERPDRGTIVVDDVDLQRLRNGDHYRRHTVGIVFQLHNLLPHLTVRGNIDVALMSTRQHAPDSVIDRILDDLGLESLADRRPPELSGGQRQRVAIARALANEPRVLLADEPTGSLDRDSVRQILGLFHRIRSERHLTIVIVTHDHEVAAAADRTLLIEDGILIRPESTPETGSNSWSE